MSSVTIIGGGHVGLTLLADLVVTKDLHAHDVTLLYARCTDAELYERSRPLRRPVRLIDVMRGTDTTRRLDGIQLGRLHSDSTPEVLAGSRYIIVTVPDIPAVRLPLLHLLADSVSLEHKILVLVRAGQADQPIVADLIRAHPAFKGVSVVLIEDSFYGTRANGSTIEFKRKLSVNVSIYSGSVGATLDGLRQLFPLGPLMGMPSWPDFVVKPGIALLFDPLGYIIHSGVALYPRNLERTRRGIRYRHYTDGIDQPLAERLDLLDQERVQLAGAFGVTAERFPRIIERQYGIPCQPDFYGMMQSCRHIYRSLSCGSIRELRNSRLLLEDLPALYTIDWLASCAGMSMPHTEEFGEHVTDMLPELGISGDEMQHHVRLLRRMPGDVGYISDLLNAPQAMVGGGSAR